MTRLIVVAGSDHGIASTVVLELVQRLGALAHWEPVGAVLQEALDALRGHGGVTAKEVDRMRRWATRWESLKPRMRVFYADHAFLYEDAHFGLLSILEGTQAPTGASYGRLKALWVDQYGTAPIYELVPTARRPK